MCACAHGTVVTAPRQVSRLTISFANKHDFTNRVYILTAFIFSRNSPRGLIIARAKHPFFFDRVDSIHAASFKVWNTWKYKMRSVRGQTSLERSAFSLPPHMNEPILTVAAERTSQLLPNHRFLFTSPQHIETQHIICFDDSLHHHLGTPLGRWIH